jgi:hypothetical protein
VQSKPGDTRFLVSLPIRQESTASDEATQSPASSGQQGSPAGLGQQEIEERS